MPKTKAVRIHTYGGSDRLHLEEFFLREIKTDEALVRIYAAAVNPVDWKIREGSYKNEEDQFPITMGQDYAGVIEKVGSDVKNFKVGDEVYGLVDGSYAQYAIIPKSDLAHKPQSIDFVSAASVPLAALTAWQAVIDMAQVRSGQKVLIHGGNGGVGEFAIQFAKWRGAHVITTGRHKGADFLRGLGADEVIDYKIEKFEDRVRDVDVILDTIGGETQARSWGIMKKGGILINFIHEIDEAAAKKADVRTARIKMQYNPGELEKIGELIDQKVIRVHVAQVFSLEEAREAQDTNERGESHGKLVLKIA